MIIQIIQTHPIFLRVVNFSHETNISSASQTNPSHLITILILPPPMAFLIRSPKLYSISNLNCKNVENNKFRVRVRVRVWSRMKDSDSNVRLYGTVKPKTVSSLKLSKVDEEKQVQNYYVNTGDAIRTLREEFPDLFYKELTFDIYRDDIVFKDPLNTFVGIENYKSIFSALRFNGRIFFKALWVDIVSVWQPVENIIIIRWTIHGIPRVPWESRGRFDGTSEYKLDKNGKIFEHRVHNIALNAPPKFQVLVMDELLQSLGCPSTPKPTYFETSSSSSYIRKIMESQKT